MPEYRVGDQIVRRKNTYMPCIIQADFGNLPPAEQAAVLKATYWADNITNSEWPVVLGHADVPRQPGWRLRKKASGWIVALARIAYLNPDLFGAIVEQARTMYADQVKADFPWATMATGLAGLRRAEAGEQTTLWVAPAGDE